MRMDNDFSTANAQTPCDGCPLSSMCCKGLACSSFAFFAAYGSRKRKGVSYLDFNKIPVQQVFNALYE